ncbi:MAG: LysR family transcriptional regulator, partial [Comamonas sp.]
MPSPYPFSELQRSDDVATPEGKQLFSRLTKQGRLRQLQLLVALQQCGSVLQAAVHLNMS